MNRPKHRLPHVAWLTGDGRIDYTKVTLEHNYRRALGDNREEARDSIGVIGQGSREGRRDATVSLIGLLSYLPSDDWELRSATVRALGYTHTEKTAKVLFAELRRVTTTSRVRLYVKDLLDALCVFPAKLVIDGFEALAEDRAYSWKMRMTFARCLEYVRRRQAHTFDVDRSAP